MELKYNTKFSFSKGCQTIKKRYMTHDLAYYIPVTLTETMLFAVYVQRNTRKN